MAVPTLYKYEGPVTSFDKVIMEKWSGYTTGTSKEKAKNNLAYRFKKTHGLVASSKIELPGKMIEV